jgi:hypothetical protein
MPRTVFVATLILVASLSSALLAQTPDVTFRSDVKQYIVNGEERRPVGVTVTLTADALLVQQPAATTTVPYAAISSMTYDRRSAVRLLAPSYGRRQKHFLTIQYKAGGAGQFVEIEMNKNLAPNLVATLEARSGQKIDRIVGN